MPDLTKIIKNGFSRGSCGLKKTPECPSEQELGKYLDKSVSVSQKDRIERHLADCGYCLDLLVTAKEALKDFPKKAECSPGPKTAEVVYLKYVELGNVLFIKRYFFQFLTLSLIFGLKWALSAEGSRNLVMIFRSLGRKDTAESEKENIFARK